MSSKSTPVVASRIYSSIVNLFKYSSEFYESSPNSELLKEKSVFSNEEIVAIKEEIELIEESIIGIKEDIIFYDENSSIKEENEYVPEKIRWSSGDYVLTFEQSTAFRRKVHYLNLRNTKIVEQKILVREKNDLESIVVSNKIEKILSTINSCLTETIVRETFEDVTSKSNLVTPSPFEIEFENNTYHFVPFLVLAIQNLLNNPAIKSFPNIDELLKSIFVKSFICNDHLKSIEPSYLYKVVKELGISKQLSMNEDYEIESINLKEYRLEILRDAYFLGKIRVFSKDQISVPSGFMHFNNQTNYPDIFNYMFSSTNYPRVEILDTVANIVSSISSIVKGVKEVVEEEDKKEEIRKVIVDSILRLELKKNCYALTRRTCKELLPQLKKVSLETKE